MPRERNKKPPAAPVSPAAGAPVPALRAARPAPKPVKSSAPGDDNAGSAILGGIEIAELRRLIRLVQRTGIGELEVSAGGRAVRISAVPGAVTAAAVPVATAPSAGPAGGSAGANAPAAPARS